MCPAVLLADWHAYFGKQRVDSRMLSDFRIRLRSLFRRQRAEAELNEELRFHIEQRTGKYVQAGMEPEEAARRARIELGGIEQTKEQCRDARGIHLLETIVQDIRFALRQFRKSPGFCAAAILILALGIGANTAIFSITNTTLLFPFGYPDSNKVVFVGTTNRLNGQPLVLDAQFEAWEQLNQSFQAMSAYSLSQSTLTGAGYPERLQTAEVTSGFFAVTGIQPALGRVFLASETRTGGPALAILSHALWASRFASSSSVIGKTIQLDEKPYTIVGVMPAGFSFPDQIEPDLLLPLDLSDAPLGGRPIQLVQVLGRLRPGVSLAQAQANLDVILQQEAKAEGGGRQSIAARFLESSRAIVVPLRDRLVGNTTPAMLVFLGAALFLLLVACVNVANLVLARALTREREIAVRVAVGAHRWRVARQLLTENMLLAALGALAGIAFALGAIVLVRDLGPENIPRLQQASLDLPVLAFTALIAALAGGLAGLAPMRAAWRLPIGEALKEGERSSSGRGHRRLRNVLMVAEIAMALVLAIGSGLLVRSFLRITALDLGFNSRNVLTAELAFPLAQYAAAPERSQFAAALLQRIDHVPGVRSAAIADAAPMSGFNLAASVELAGRPPDNSPRAPSVGISAVGPGFFRTMQIPLIAGREFTAGDSASSAPVAIVNQAFVRRYFSNVDPLGQTVKEAKDIASAAHSPNVGPLGQKASGNSTGATVVGVVGNIRQQGLLNASMPTLYVPYAQQPSQFLSLIIRTNGDPEAIVPALRAQVEEMDNRLPVFDVATMEQRLGKMEAAQRFETVVLGVFALLALVLAAVGVYGVIAYSVSERTREIGIRIALGAQRTTVTRMILRHTTALALTGVAIGIAAALALTGFLQSLLFQIRPDDPWTFASAALLLLAAAVLASILPARRAATIDPVATLRHE